MEEIKKSHLPLLYETLRKLEMVSKMKNMDINSPILNITCPALPNKVSGRRDYQSGPPDYNVIYTMPCIRHLKHLAFSYTRIFP